MDYGNDIETNKYIFLVTFDDDSTEEYEDEASEEYIKERIKFYKEHKRIKKVKIYRLYGKEYFDGLQ